jgi:hypothetical protein
LAARCQVSRLSISRVSRQPVYCTLSAATLGACEVSTETIGPLLRRGTTKVTPPWSGPNGATDKAPARGSGCGARIPTAWTMIALLFSCSIIASLAAS